MACAICEIRKDKRFCPAVHGRICSTCCGTQREITLDCPSDCSYLLQARRLEGRRDLSTVRHAELFPQVDLPKDLSYRREPLIVGLSYSIVQAARRDRSLNDCEVIEALTSLGKAYETLVGSGLVYETATASPVQQAIVAELKKMIAEYRETEKKQLGYHTLRDAEAFGVIVWMVRLAHAYTSGRPRSRAFLDFLCESFPQRGSVIAGPEESGGRLIVP